MALRVLSLRRFLLRSRTRKISPGASIIRSRKPSSSLIDFGAVRPELEKLVAFSEPTRTNVIQVVVTGPGAPPIATVHDLAGREVFVRKGSVYYETLTGLNEQLKTRGKPPVVIDEAPNALEDDDILEMVNAGLAPITIVDNYLPNSGNRCSQTQRAQRRQCSLRRLPGPCISQGQSPDQRRGQQVDPE